MSMTDPIADLLTRLRNGSRARLEKVEMPASRIKRNLSQVLKEEGFIREVEFREDGKQGIISLTLRYDRDGTPAISEIRRQSKPGLRRYVSVDEIPAVKNGLGIAVLSTSKGVLVDREARAQKVGGELLCTVW